MAGSEALARLMGALSSFGRGNKGGSASPFAGLAGRLRRAGLLAAASRFVLLIGDEGATLVQFRRNRVVDAWFIAADAEDGAETLRATLGSDKDAVVVAAADVLEQMYREEALPKAGRLDRKVIMRRRLDLAFPHDRLKAALPLGRTEHGGQTVLFAALPVSEAMGRWIELLEDLPNPVVGPCLLPLESAGLAARLRPSEGFDGPRLWRVLVSQQAASGFRQIFETDGHFVVTRLTQRPPGDLSADAVAMLIERELRSSISYVKRLGYVEGDRLDMVVLADPAVCKAVGQRDLPVSSLTALTPLQASRALGFADSGPPDSPYADVLHACDLAARARPLLSLPTEPLRQRLQFRQAFRLGFVGAVGLTLATLLYVGSLLGDYVDEQSSIAVAEQQVRTEQQALDLARHELQRFAIPADELAQVVATEDRLDQRQVNPSAVLRLVAGALDSTVRVQKITFGPPAAPTAGAAPARPAAKGKADDVPYEVRLTVRFLGDASADPDIAARLATQLKDRLAASLPGYDVQAVQLPLGMAGGKVLEGGAGGAGSGATAQGGQSAEFVLRRRA